jgi:hypothetical protein
MPYERKHSPVGVKFKIVCTSCKTFLGFARMAVDGKVLEAPHPPNGNVCPNLGKCPYWDWLEERAPQIIDKLQDCHVGGPKACVLTPRQAEKMH